jgi:hypothetical protein
MKKRQAAAFFRRRRPEPMVEANWEGQGGRTTNGSCLKKLLVQAKVAPPDADDHLPVLAGGQ